MKNVPLKIRKPSMVINAFNGGKEEVFLMDKINNYDKSQEYRWTEVIITHCMIFSCPGFCGLLFHTKVRKLASIMQTSPPRNKLVLERNLHTNGKRVTGDFAVNLFAVQTGELLTAVRSWKTRYITNNIKKQYVKAAI
jgi:hypothetical protein